MSEEEERRLIGEIRDGLDELDISVSELVDIYYSGLAKGETQRTLTP